MKLKTTNFGATAGGYQDRTTNDELVQSTSIFRLIFFGSVLVTPIISPGSIGSFNSIAQPQLNLSVDDASWFGSIVSITSPLGSLFIALIIDRYGRKISLLCGILPAVIGWSLLADKDASLTRLLIGRALTGFAIGACLLPSVIYAAECVTVNHHRIRSSMGTLVSLSMATGGLIVYFLGTILPYNLVALFCGCLSIVSLLLVLLFIPESPAWLHRKGRLTDAEKAQKRLGIPQPILQNREVRPAAVSVVVDGEPQPSEPRADTFRYYLQQIRKPEVYKPLIITTLAEFFCQFAGLYCVSAYTVNLIAVHPWEAHSYVLSLVAQAFQIVGCLLFSLALPYSGLRVMSILSFLGVLLGHTVLACSFLFEHDSSAPNIFNYLHVVAVWQIMLAGMGVLGITNAIVGEVFPMGVKGLAGIPTFMGSGFTFVVLKIYPHMIVRYGGVVFFGFAFVSACGIAFVVTCLPETVGKTMDEITSGFKARSSTNNGEQLS